MAFPPVKEVALQHNIPVFQPIKIREPECVERLATYHADVMVVVAFGQILPQEILDLTPYGCINVHASLLPKYRGAAPIQWAIIDGEEVTGVTTMQMDAGLDTGDMLLKAEVVIQKEETGGSLHDKLMYTGAKLCAETLVGLEEQTLTRTKQGESPTAYAKMLDKHLGNIDWTKKASEIERLIRGLNPWPSAYSYLEEKMVKIWEVQVETTNTNAEPGRITKIEKESIYVQTGSGQLIIKELQIQGKRRMKADAFLRGYQFNESMKFIRR